VQVDGTWLYGKYRGTLLLAVAQDGNHHIFPVAFAIVEGETKEAWSFFLKNLRTYVTPQNGICLISDRNPSIKSAYEDPQNGWTANTSTHIQKLARNELKMQCLWQTHTKSLLLIGKNRFTRSKKLWITMRVSQWVISWSTCLKIAVIVENSKHYICLAHM
jgi:hypothetical protein